MLCITLSHYPSRSLPRPRPLSTYLSTPTYPYRGVDRGRARARAGGGVGPAIGLGMSKGIELTFTIDSLISLRCIESISAAGHLHIIIIYQSGLVSCGCGLSMIRSQPTIGGIVSCARRPPTLSLAGCGISMIRTHHYSASGRANRSYTHTHMVYPLHR